MPRTGSQLREARRQVGLSQFRLAKLSGLTSHELSHIERHDLPIDPGLDVELARLIEEWCKPPKKVVAGSRRRGRMPQAPGIQTDCCAKPSTSATDGLTSFVALFAGAGGLAAGFRSAGAVPLGFVEVDAAARATFKRNFPSARCLAHSVEDLDPAAVPLRPDLIIGGPPCQGFSLAGKRDEHDERNTLFTHLLEAADAWNPSMIVMENVRLLLSMRTPTGGLVIDDVLAQFDAHGYSAQVWTMNAAEYGVPQTRERVFIVATVKGVPAPQCPRPSHSVVGADLVTPRAVTFGEATGDLPPLESGEWSPADPLHWAVAHPEHVIRWLQDVPEGGSAHENADRALRPPSGYNTTYKRLVWDEPGATILTTFGMISGTRTVHPRDTRSLTIREAARIQTFPDDYLFEGTWSQIRTQIGNAVPPGLAEVVARAIMPSVLRDR